jgi:hypothetical protein
LNSLQSKGFHQPCSQVAADVEACTAPQHPTKPLIGHSPIRSGYPTRNVTSAAPLVRICRPCRCSWRMDFAERYGDCYGRVEIGGPSGPVWVSLNASPRNAGSMVPKLWPSTASRERPIGLGHHLLKVRPVPRPRSRIFHPRHRQPQNDPLLQPDATPTRASGQPPFC